MGAGVVAAGLFEGGSQTTKECKAELGAKALVKSHRNALPALGMQQAGKAFRAFAAKTLGVTVEQLSQSGATVWAECSKGCQTPAI